MTALIGKKIKVIDSKNRALIGIQGIIVDESQNILSVETNGKIKKLVKDQCVFDIEGNERIK